MKVHDDNAKTVVKSWRLRERQRDRDAERNRNKYEDVSQHIFRLLKTLLDNLPHINKLVKLLRASRSFAKTGLSWRLFGALGALLGLSWALLGWSWDVLGVLLVAQEVPRGPKTLQEAPKRLQEAPKRPPRDLKEISKRIPRGKVW